MNLPVHPAADAFRLMTQDELAALADDIAENGLKDPITLGKINGAKTAMLIDGRNRLEACKLAEVEPRFETIEFADDAAVAAFVRSRSERRNISAGQKAMAHAMLFPSPAKRGGRPDRGKQSLIVKDSGFTAGEEIAEMAESVSEKLFGEKALTDAIGSMESSGEFSDLKALYPRFSDEATS